MSTVRDLSCFNMARVLLFKLFYLHPSVLHSVHCSNLTIHRIPFKQPRMKDLWGGLYINPKFREAILPKGCRHPTDSLCVCKKTKNKTEPPQLLYNTEPLYRKNINIQIHLADWQPKHFLQSVVNIYRVCLIILINTDIDSWQRAFSQMFSNFVLHRVAQFRSRFCTDICRP